MIVFRSLFVGIALLLGACASQSTSDLLSVSRDPDMTGVQYDRIFVMAISADETRRRLIENTVAQNLRGAGVEAVTSWSYIERLDVNDKQALRQAAEAAVAKAGADAALVGKLLREDRRTEYGPPQVEQTLVPNAPVYMGFGTYVGYGYQTVVSPGELREVHEYFLQSSLYDVASGQPVWRAQSVTLNPDNVEQAVTDVADMLVRRLAEDGVLANGVVPRGTGGY